MKSMTLRMLIAALLAMAWFGETHANPLPSYYYVTVTFDANGGTVSKTSIRQRCDKKIGTLPTPKREGYMFEGWYTERTGGWQISSSTVIWDLDGYETVTVYAHWSSGNGGSQRFKGTITLDGTIDQYDGSRYRPKGTIELKIKASARDNTLTGTVKMNIDGRKVTYKGWGTQSPYPYADNGWYDVELHFDNYFCEGSIGTDGKEYNGCLNFYNTYDSSFEAYLGPRLKTVGAYVGSYAFVFADGSSFLLTVKQNGTAKLAGTLADGTKISSSSRAVYNSCFDGGIEFPFSLQLRDGRTFSCSFYAYDDYADYLLGHTEYDYTEYDYYDSFYRGSMSLSGRYYETEMGGRAGGNLPASVGLELWYGGAAAPDPWDEDDWLVEDAFPWWMELTTSGGKLILPKAGRVSIERGTGEIVSTGENPSGMKLTYKPATGQITGSFNFYAVTPAYKLKKYALKVSGIYIKGYGARLTTTYKNKPTSVEGWLY